MNFQVVRCLPNLSTIIAIDLSFIDKLVIQSFVNFQIVCCSPNLSTFNANTSSSDHLFIFKQGVVRQIFPNSSWGRTKAHFVKKNVNTQSIPSHFENRAGQGPISSKESKNSIYSTEKKNSKLSDRQNITYKNFPDRARKSFLRQKCAYSA